MVRNLQHSPPPVVGWGGGVGVHVASSTRAGRPAGVKAAALLHVHTPGNILTSFLGFWVCYHFVILCFRRSERVFGVCDGDHMGLTIPFEWFEWLSPL